MVSGPLGGPVHDMLDRGIEKGFEDSKQVDNDDCYQDLGESCRKVRVGGLIACMQLDRKD